MKCILNQRNLQRMNDRPTTRNSSSVLTCVRLLADNSLVVKLPRSVCATMGRGKGDRVWLYLLSETLHVTPQPWGKNVGRRRTTRLRLSHTAKRCGNALYNEWLSHQQPPALWAARLKGSRNA
jgi:hypothetical protein